MKRYFIKSLVAGIATALSTLVVSVVGAVLLGTVSAFFNPSHTGKNTYPGQLIYLSNITDLKIQLSLQK